MPALSWSVETLGTNLESQTFHLFEDMVASLEGEGLKVAYRVIHFIVDDILQRGDLWELICHKLQQLVEALHFGTVVDACHHNQHQFAGRGGAYNKVAQHALVRAQVTEGIAMR